MEEFIKILTEQIRCVRAREGIAQEISNHILDQTEAFEQKGMSHEQALERAVQEMGDPVEIGLSMDQIHRPQIDWKMMLITFLLSIVGLVCMMPMFGVTYVISRQLLFTLAGFGVIAAVCLLDYSVLGRTGIAAGIVLTVVFFNRQAILFSDDKWAYTSNVDFGIFVCACVCRNFISTAQKRL